jgi:hypothetical protein
MMIEAYMGNDKYQNVYGLFKVKKIYVPWIMMILI